MKNSELAVKTYYGRLGAPESLRDEAERLYDMAFDC
jgi:hypothetical protein